MILLNSQWPCWYCSLEIVIYHGKKMFGKMRIFQKVFIGVMLAFMGLMAIVTFYAYSRTSGSTRQDMAEAQFIRQRAILEKRNNG